MGKGNSTMYIHGGQVMKQKDVKNAKRITCFKIYIGFPWWLGRKEYVCQCRGHSFDPWSGKNPTCQGAARSLRWKLLKPARLEPVFYKRCHCLRSPHITSGKEPPRSATRESPHTATAASNRKVKYSFTHLYKLCVLTQICPIFATPCTAAHQSPLSVGFSRQESWSGLPFPSPGDLPDPGIEPTPPEPPALAGRFSATVPLEKPLHKLEPHGNTDFPYCKVNAIGIYTIAMGIPSPKHH